MKKTKKILILCAALAFIFGLDLTANAQRRKTPRKRTTTAAKTTPPAATAAANNAEIKSSARKVSDQVKNVTRFIYVLGGIATGIEDIDKQSKTRKVSQSALSINDANKKKVIESIRGIRAGLAVLETEFKTKPALKLYNFNIQGISDMTARAEDLALGGQFTESGKALLSVVEKLSDTLVSLP